MQLVWAGEQGQPLTLADYAMGKDADLTRRCTLFDQVLAQLHALLCTWFCLLLCLLACSVADSPTHPTTPTQQTALVHVIGYADILFTK